MILDRVKAMELFDSGTFSSAVILPTTEICDQWILMLESENGERKSLTPYRKNTAKVYKSADAALSDARLLGFEFIKVEFFTKATA